MNIFRIHPNAWDSANLLLKYDPVRARKQLLESCQIIASVEHAISGRTTMLKADGQPYKAAHPHHPCVRWSVNARQQYDMLCTTTHALASLMTEHACSKSFFNSSAALVCPRNTDYGMIVVRKGYEHRVVHSINDYALLMREYLEMFKGFPKDATL